MTNQRTFSSRFALRSFAVLLPLALLAGAVAGLSLASDPDAEAAGGEDAG